MALSAVDVPSQKELISFRIAEQEYCVDVMSIREIRGWTAATRIPQSPAFVCGVINLRGTVLPIIDLAARLGLSPAQPTARHAIIVAHIEGQTVGLLVEGVSDIFSVDERQIQATPEVASEVAKHLVRGVIPLEGRLVSVISIENILPSRLES